VLAVCGDNPRLYSQTIALQERVKGRLHVEAFTQRIAEFLQASDLLVTKPGPGSLAEALHMRVPVVVAGTRRTIPQERFNVEFVGRHELGLIVRSWSELPAAVRAYWEDAPRRARIQANVRALPENRAVWEAVDIITASLPSAARR
jgi:1,2-diacylglycerol 3-beta-galactosyltransferase